MGLGGNLPEFSRAFSVYAGPKWHNVGDALIEFSGCLPDQVREDVPRLAAISGVRPNAVNLSPKQRFSGL
jgi:hypothetical protein